MRAMCRMMAGALLSAGLMAGGCASGLEEQNQLLQAENVELRDNNARLEQSVEDERRRAAAAEGRSQSLQLQLDSANQKLRIMELERPAITSDDMGFEGIEGANVSRRSSGEVVVGIAGDVLFDSGSVTLKSAAKATLNRVASELKGRYGGNVIRIEGYTDTDPIRKSKWKTNERLSAERALAVEAHLVSQGVPGDRIYSAAFGPAQPKSTKKASRRVEIVILGS